MKAVLGALLASSMSLGTFAARVQQHEVADLGEPESSLTPYQDFMKQDKPMMIASMRSSSNVLLFRVQERARAHSINEYTWSQVGHAADRTGDKTILANPDVFGQAKPYRKRQHGKKVVAFKSEDDEQEVFRLTRPRSKRGRPNTFFVESPKGDGSEIYYTIQERIVGHCSPTARKYRALLQDDASLLEFEQELHEGQEVDAAGASNTACRPGVNVQMRIFRGLCDGNGILGQCSEVDGEDLPGDLIYSASSGWTFGSDLAGGNPKTKNITFYKHVGGARTAIGSSERVAMKKFTRGLDETMDLRIWDRDVDVTALLAAVTVRNMHQDMRDKKRAMQIGVSVGVGATTLAVAPFVPILIPGGIAAAGR